VLFFNYAAVDPTLTNEKCSFWHFRFDANTEMKMEAISNFMETDKKIKKVFIIGQDYAHGHQVAKYTKEMLAKKRKDIKIVGEDLHPIGRVKDFAPYIAKIKASGADTVMTGNWGNDLSLLIKAAKDAGLKARFFTYYAGGLGTPQAMGAAGENMVLQLTEWHMNVPTVATEKFALDFNKKYPGVWFYYLRVNNMVQMVAKAMNTAKSTDPKAVALALEDLRMPVDTGEVWMRKSDHQAMQPLYISIFSKKDGKAVKHDSEGTGYGWKTLASISQRDSQLPTSCIMERP
jgi:branched-chain amino acid transport system substrate-binding protein